MPTKTALISYAIIAIVSVFVIGSIIIAVIIRSRRNTEMEEQDQKTNNNQDEKTNNNEDETEHLEQPVNPHLIVKHHNIPPNPAFRWGMPPWTASRIVHDNEVPIMSGEPENNDLYSVSNFSMFNTPTTGTYRAKYAFNASTGVGRLSMYAVMSQTATFANLIMEITDERNKPLVAVNLGPIALIGSENGKYVQNEITGNIELPDSTNDTWARFAHVAFSLFVDSVLPGQTFFDLNIIEPVSRS